MNQIAKEWQDYEVIDTGNKEKLERWNQTILRRPDPGAIWPIEDERAWNKADAVYHALKSVQPDLNTQDYSLNKLATGILWPIRSKNQNVMI